jgi:hypothetical protein
MGLLDILSGNWTEDPNQNQAIRQGLLGAAFGAMAGRGTRLQAIGQGGLTGLMGYGSELDRQGQAKRQGFQDQIQRFQLETMKRQQADEEALRGAVRNSVVQPTMPQTMDSRDVGQPGEPSMLPRFDVNRYAAQLAQIGSPQALQAYQSLQKEAPKPIISKPGEIARDESGRIIWQNPSEQKPADLPSAVREYEYARAQGFAGSFDEWDRGRRKAGASSVNVPINMGQKGFDNTLKLRGDFRSEPVYKAHQEMQSAYSQIRQSLKQESPAGDLAGATKIMKLLDPGSVVRESELGMAMAASGLLDRVQNYAGMVMNGTKLTPNQRKDFQKLADALYSESVGQYNRKRTEYKGIVDRNGLNESDVLGDPSGSPAQANALGNFSAEAIDAELARRKKLDKK